MQTPSPPARLDTPPTANATPPQHMHTSKGQKQLQKKNKAATLYLIVIKSPGKPHPITEPM